MPAPLPSNMALSAAGFYERLTPGFALTYLSTLDQGSPYFDVIGIMVEHEYPGVHCTVGAQTVTLADNTDIVEVMILPFHDLLMQKVIDQAILVASGAEDHFDGKFGRIKGVYVGTVEATTQLLQRIAQPSIIQRVRNLVSRIGYAWRTSL